MRFETIKLHGLGPFSGEVDLDLSRIAGRLIAITGANGAGKSTLLELLAGSLFRECPTRGSLASLATARDAFVEVDVVNGQRYRVRQLVDAVSGKGEALIANGEGRPLVESGKVRDFDHYVAAHLTPPEVFYSSVFAAQGSGGFLEMRPAERKGVLLRVLGIERLEQLSQAARARLTDAKSEAAVIAARIAEQLAASGNVAEIAAAQADSARRAQAATIGLEIVQRDLADIDVRISAATEAKREVEADLARRIEMRLRLTAARQRVEALERKVKTARATLEECGDVAVAEAAEARMVAIDDLVDRFSASAEQARAEARHHAGEERLQEQAAMAADREAREARGRGARSRERLTLRSEVDAARASLPRLTADVEASSAEYARIERELTAAGEISLVTLDGRIAKLRGGLTRILLNADDPGPTAKVTLEHDDDLAEQAREAPARLRELQRQRKSAAEDYQGALNRRTQAELMAQRAGGLAEAEADAAREDAIAAETAARIDPLTAKALEHHQAAERAKEDVAALETKIAGLRAERAALAPRAAMKDAAAVARARLDELEPMLSAEDATAEELGREVGALGVDPKPPAIPDRSQLFSACQVAELAAREAGIALGIAEERLKAARAASERVELLRAQERKTDEAVADWSRLAEDLGPKGLQALEVDAAGPEITVLVNDLLHKAFGTRFTVQFETTRTSADGSKELEVFDIRILDNERGREGDVTSLSGGERVIISEAIALALSMLVCQRHGVRSPTVIRDESGAALDPENAFRYVTMLRRAIELVDADKILLVSHSPAVQEMCDARIHVEDGRIEVRA